MATASINPINMSGVYKAASEAAALLAQKYDGPMKSVQGRGGRDYDYIPWQDSARQLDRVFGPFGWDARVVSVTSSPAEGVYTAAVEVTARVIDDATGGLISITRGAVGRGTATPSKYEKENGVNVALDLGAHDTAAAAAGSDAFSRACKLLGDAFGLFLYDKKDGYQSAPATRTQGATRTASGPAGTAGASGGARPSAKQMGVFLDRGYTQEQIDALDFKEWKSLIDALFGKGTPAIAPEGTPKERTMSASRKAAAPVAEEDSDDIPW